MSDFHFLRPGWLGCLLPLFLFLSILWRQTPRLHAWSAICDEHLLSPLIRKGGGTKRYFALMLLFFSSFFMIIALSGPSWSRLPVPAYHTIQPRVLVLDMSEAMLATDLTPDRLTRAKFKVQDLVSRQNTGQLGLVVYTGEPFIVSPLTEDGNTITALLQSLTPDVMPLGGHKLNLALAEGASLITQAGFTQGQLLVLTATPPDAAAIKEAEKLSKKGLTISVLPMVAEKTLGPLFKPFAVAGHGMLLPFSDTSLDLDKWLRSATMSQQFSQNEDDNIPVWRDEGRWFLGLALLLLLPVFRRGWLQRLAS